MQTSTADRQRPYALRSAGPCRIADRLRDTRSQKRVAIRRSQQGSRPRQSKRRPRIFWNARNDGDVPAQTPAQPMPELATPQRRISPSSHVAEQESRQNGARRSLADATLSSLFTATSACPGLLESEYRGIGEAEDSQNLRETVCNAAKASRASFAEPRRSGHWMDTRDSFFRIAVVLVVVQSPGTPDPFMRVQHHRASRLPFVAGIQVTSLDSGDQIAAHTEDLNLFGCFVETITPLAEGTQVEVRISHNGASFVAQGKVAHSERGKGMGIRFTSVEPSSAPVLDAWLTELQQ